MKKVFSLTLVFSFIFMSALQAGPPREMARKLKIIIPKVRLQGVTAEQALAYLRRVSRQMDPEGQGLNIIYVKPQEKKAIKK
jgi:hypothetical protein